MGDKKSLVDIYNLVKVKMDDNNKITEGQFVKPIIFHKDV
mgnify:FL=1|jgi:hypothetical protein